MTGTWGLAIRLVLRASSTTNDNTLDRVLSRTRVATLPAEQADNLSEAWLRIIDRGLSDHLVATSQPRTTTAIEVLSRLAVRVNPDIAESLLNRAKDYCQNPQLARGTWSTEIRHLLQRSWQALPQEYRRRRALDLLNASIAGLDSPAPSMAQAWPDPAEALTSTNSALQRTLENEELWKAAVALVARGLNGDITARSRAANRMIPLVLSNQLTKDESLEIAHAVPRQLFLPVWRQLFLPVHLLGLAPLLGRVGPVAGDVKLQDDGVMDHPVDGRGGGHGVGEDALPLREDQV